MELVLVGVICWLWFRLRAARAAEGRRARSSVVGPFASVIVCEAGGHLYWMRNGLLVRAPVGSGLADMGAAVPVDPLTVGDVDPATVIEIIEALESVQGRAPLGPAEGRSV